MTDSRMIPVDRVLEILDSKRNHLRRERDAMIDSVRDAILAEFPDAAPAPTGRPHVTPIGDGIGVKPLGSPDPMPPVNAFTGERESKPARANGQKIKYKFGPAGSIETISLTAGQHEGLRTVATRGPSYRDQICPRRFLSGATSRSLVNKDLLRQRNYPVVGYQLTERGKAVADALTRKD